MVGWTVVLFCISSCALRRDTDAIDKTLYDCETLASPEGQHDWRGGDLWFYANADRARLSRELWTARGIEAIRRRLESVESQNDRECLLRLLREAQNREVE
jgi:hypothetical protein